VVHLLFMVFGRDHNVILETIKCGDLDTLDSSHAGPHTIMLQLYKAYGGHACICLRVNVPGVIKAYAMNLLKDDNGAEEIPLKQMTGEWGEQLGKLLLRLSFCGFEAKTIKLMLAK
jgi:hypothetical protein